MQQEKWEQLVGRIKDEFAVEEQQTQDGVMAGEKIETIVFVNPAGKMKLQRVVKPRFLGEKKDVIFIGQNAVYPGSAMCKTFVDEVPAEKRIELLLFDDDLEF